MRTMRVLITLVIQGAPISGSAQPMPPGTRVRLTTPATLTGWHVGRITTMTHDSVHLVYANGDSAAMALADVGLMDSSRGTRTPLWALLSSVVTVPAGGLAGIMTAMAVSVVDRTPLGNNFDTGVSVGAAAGLVAGVVIAVTKKSEDWRPIMLPPAKGHAASNSPDAAKATPVYRPRMRLKLRVEGRQVVGTLIEQRDDSIVLAWNSGHTSYALASVRDVRVSRGKSVWTGAKFGGLIGAGVGLVTSVFVAATPNNAYDPIDSDCDPNTESCRYESDALRAAKHLGGYALAGAAAGAVIRHERWVKGELPARSSDHEPARLLLAPDRRGLRIGVSATF